MPEDPSEYSLPIFAADLAALLKAIGIERAHIGGVSMGGMVYRAVRGRLPGDVRVGDAHATRRAATLRCYAVPPEEPDAAAQWEQRLVTGITLLKEAVRQYGLEATLLREWEWKKANDPHLDESPYTSRTTSSASS